MGLQIFLPFGESTPGDIVYSVDVLETNSPIFVVVQTMKNNK